MSDIDDKSYLLGVNLERERIIKLLESIRVGDDWIGRDYAIALIKGEEA